MKKETILWWRAFLRSMPGKLGENVRRRLYGYRSAEGSRVLSHVLIYYPENLVIGAHSSITAYCQLNAKAGITIGDNVLIGPGTFIWSQNHKMQDATVNIREQGYERAPVVIEDDVWVAARCVILPGVRLAKGTVVAAGAVVTRSTEPYSIVAGVPAREISKRGVSSTQCASNGSEVAGSFPQPGDK